MIKVRVVQSLRKPILRHPLLAAKLGANWVLVCNLGNMKLFFQYGNRLNIFLAFLNIKYHIMTFCSYRD